MLKDLRALLLPTTPRSASTSELDLNVKKEFSVITHWSKNLPALRIVVMPSRRFFSSSWVCGACWDLWRLDPNFMLNEDWVRIEKESKRVDKRVDKRDGLWNSGDSFGCNIHEEKELVMICIAHKSFEL